MKRCKFCEAMKVNRQCLEISKSWITEEEKAILGEFMGDFSVAIVKRTWFSKRGKKHAARTTEYRYRGLGYTLNYCPECGKSLKGGNDE